MVNDQKEYTPGLGQCLLGENLQSGAEIGYGSEKVLVCSGCAFNKMGKPQLLHKALL